MTKERMTAGPACCAAAVPVYTKIPAPMIAPMPMRIRFTGPSARRSSLASATTGSGVVRSVTPACVIVLAPLLFGGGGRGVAQHEPRRSRMTNAVDRVDHEANHRPRQKPQPGIDGKERHHETAHEDTEWRDDPHERCAERPFDVWTLHAQHHDSGAH